MNVTDNIIIPAQGCVLRRKSDGLVRYGITLLGKTFRIGNKNYENGVDEKPEDYEDGIMLKVDGNSVAVGLTDSYDTLVSELVHTRYTSDGEVALINNALSDIANIADNAEYAEYQRWRNKCKETAKNYLGL